MLSDELAPDQYLPFLLTQVIGLSAEAAKQLIEKYGEIEVQTHALRCIWLMQRGRVHTPPGWLTASLRGGWQATPDMPLDLEPQVMTFRIDEQTFGQFVRKERAEKTGSEIRER
jgi:hypothetical protein